MTYIRITASYDTAPQYQVIVDSVERCYAASLDHACTVVATALAGSADEVRGFLRLLGAQ